MSRIQHILDKADREGGIRRVTTVGDVAPPPGVHGATAAATAPALAPPLDADVPFVPAHLAFPVDAEPSAAVPPPPARRVVRGVRLHPLLAAAGAGPAGEQYRSLRTRIIHADHRGGHMLMVTSPGRGEGKTVTASNLALTMAQEYQRRSCIVDADLRRPQVSRMFGVPEAPGLSEVLIGSARLEEALVTIEEYQLTVLPAGRATGHPGELLGTTAMRRLIETLRAQFDRVVIDAPAASPLADVGILTPLVDGVVLVVRAGVTATPAIHEALAAIDSGKMLGVVLNEAAGAGA